MIKIEKRISLDFIGEGYSDSYVVFESIPMKEYTMLQDKIEAIQETNDSKLAMQFMVDLLDSKFIKGEIKQGEKMQEITKQDLQDMPGEFFMGVMERLTGQSPKA